MNKLIAILILLIVIATSVVIITSQQANSVPKYEFPVSINRINNTTIIHYPKYNIEEQIVNGVNYIYFVNDSSSNITPDITTGSVPTGDNFTVELTFNGNFNNTSNNNFMVAYIQGFSDAGKFNFNGYISLDYAITNIIGILPDTSVFYAECGNTAYASFNLTFTNQYYNLNDSLTSLNGSITYSPTAISYNSNNTEYSISTSSPKTYITNYSISYYYSNIGISSVIYSNVFTSNNNTFSLFINNEQFINVKSVVILLPNGVYAYNYSIGNKSSQGLLYVNGKDTDTVLSITSFSNATILFLYLGIVFISLILIGKYTRGFVITYSLSGILFLFIGYKEQIEFFNQDLILIIITFLALLFTYKVVIED